MGSRHALAALALLLQSACSSVAIAPFERTLAANPSATAALRDWCEARRIAAPARITAAPVKGADAPPPAELTALLGPATSYRHVRLSCGNSILSEAHNWYARDRLTPEMNRRLDTTDTPFGTVIAPLQFTREPLSSRHGASPECPSGTILSHRARLRLPDGKPLALLVECYTRANIKH